MQNLILLFVSILLLHACASIPANTHQQTERIATGMGPEDILLDSLSTSKVRLLVSSQDHRLRAEAPNGDIYAINLDETPLKSYKLTRIGEPDGHDFHPHGFDLIRREDGKVYLFVVSHDDKKDEHFVYKYHLSGNNLNFIKSYKNPVMNSPNTVVALRKKGFYVSNDQKKRGDQFAALMKARNGSILYCNEDGGWAVVADKLAFPNGLYISPKERYLYASTTRQNHIFKYGIKKDGNLVQQEKVTKLVGGDNIRLAQNKELLIPGHLNILKFAQHFKDSTKTSPSVVYYLDTQNGEKKVAYSNDGQQISAASTAIKYKNYIYISQVFQPYILRIKDKTKVSKN